MRKQIDTCKECTLLTSRKIEHLEALIQQVLNRRW
jgi:hypothetical protein